jgi:hypothetical protein
LGATFADGPERLPAINELAALGLSAANSDLFTQLGKSQLFQLSFSLSNRRPSRRISLCVW